MSRERKGCSVRVSSDLLRGRFSCVLPLAILSIVTGCVQNAPAPSSDQAVELLRHLVGDESPEVRRTAVESLGKIGASSAVVSILPLLGDASSSVRIAAAQALGRVGSSHEKETVAALARSLGDPAEAVRRAAALAIGEIEPTADQLKPVVMLAKDTPDARIREAAVRALAQLDVARWEDDLIPILRDPDAAVRQAAVAALGPSGGVKAASELQRQLAEDRSPSVRAEAVYQLGKLKGADVRRSLERAAATDVHGDVRRWAEAELKS